jgi:hypothetical protein
VTTYLRDRNLFQLAPPPAWWLRRLADFDGDLVVIPSRERPLFWLARRIRFARPFTGRSFTGLTVAPDSQMFATHHLVNVVTIASLTWSEQALLELLGWLKRHDTWAHEGGPLDPDAVRTAAINGGSRFTKAIEDAEREAARREARTQRETIYHATGDAWRSLTARRGSRLLNAGIPRPPVAAA